MPRNLHTCKSLPDVEEPNTSNYPMSIIGRIVRGPTRPPDVSTTPQDEQSGGTISQPETRLTTLHHENETGSRLRARQIVGPTPQGGDPIQTTTLPKLVTIADKIMNGKPASSSATTTSIPTSHNPEEHSPRSDQDETNDAIIEIPPPQPPRTSGQHGLAKNVASHPIETSYNQGMKQLLTNCGNIMIATVFPNYNGTIRDEESENSNQNQQQNSDFVIDMTLGESNDNAEVGDNANTSRRESIPRPFSARVKSAFLDWDDIESDIESEIETDDEDIEAQIPSTQKPQPRRDLLATLDDVGQNETPPLQDETSKARISRPGGGGIANLVGQMMTVQAAGKRMLNEAEINRNFFLGSLQSLQTVINVGACQFLSPFIITEDEGVFKPQTNVVHQTIVTTSLCVATAHKTYEAYRNWELVELKENPESGLEFMIHATTALLLWSYLFCVTLNRSKFKKIYTNFRIRSADLANEIKNRKIMLLICTSLMTLGFFGITNYVEWGSTLYSKGWIGLEKEIIKKYRKVNINHGDWLIGKEWMARINLVLNVNVQCVLTHIYFVMWSSALSLFKTQRDTKKLVSEGMMRMEIRKTIDVFRRIKYQIHALSGAIAPITMACVIQLIPTCVDFINKFAKKELEWYNILVIVVKIGHLIVAAEAAANADNLADRVLTLPDTYKDCTPKDLIELTNVTQRSISLRGLDFFAVNYKVLGAILLSIVTYYLLLVELETDEATTTDGPCSTMFA